MTPALLAAPSTVRPELFLAQVRREGVGLASARAMDNIEYHSGSGDKQGTVRIFRLCRKWFVALGYAALIPKRDAQDPNLCEKHMVSARRNPNFRFARHLDTMRSSRGIERIFAETPELNFAFEGEQMYDGRPKARARKWRSRLLPEKSYEN